MKFCHTKSYFTLTMLIVCTCYFYLIYNVSHYKLGKFTKRTFLLVKGSSFYMYTHNAVISTNLDGKEGILIIGFIRTPITGHKTESKSRPLDCFISYQDGTNETVKSVLEDVPPSLKERFRYEAAFCWCFPTKVNNTIPVFVSLHSRPSASKKKNFRPALTKTKVAVEEKTPDMGHNKFALCLPFIYYYKSASAFIEMMEIHKIQGVSKVIMHGYSNVSQQVEKVIRYYVSTGYIELLPWNVDGWRSSYGLKRFVEYNVIRIDGSHLAKYDCLHRYKNQYQYMILTDLDEIIQPSASEVPQKFPKLIDYINKAYNVTESQCQYFFHWSVFCVKKEPVAMKGLHQKLFTEENIMRATPARNGKIIVDTRNAYTVATHHVVHCRKSGRNIHVDPKIAKCHHYRYKPTIDQLGHRGGCHISDQSALRMTTTLKKSLLNATKQIGAYQYHKYKKV